MVGSFQENILKKAAWSKRSKKATKLTKARHLGCIFVDFVTGKDLGNVRFHSFEREPGFYFFAAVEVLEFDSERRGTEFTYKCNALWYYKRVAGATSAFLRNARAKVFVPMFSLTKSFKIPMITVGIQTFDLLKKEKFLGLTYKP